MLFIWVPLWPPEQRVLRCAVSGFSCPGWRQRLRLLLLCLVLIMSPVSWAAVINRTVKMTLRSRHVGFSVGGAGPGHATPHTALLIQNINRGDLLQGVQRLQRHHGSWRGTFGLTETRALSGVGHLRHGFLVNWDRRKNKRTIIKQGLKLVLLHRIL